MTSKVYSSTFTGLQCHIIEVEADISNGLSHFSIVGLGDTSVHESKDRIRASIKNSSLTFPTTRKTINLAPAQIPKKGSIFDLPIATSLLLASKQLSPERIKSSIMVGELSLNGEIKPINGVLPITHFAKKSSFKKIFIPEENLPEASFINDIEIIPIKNLTQLVNYCNNHLEIKTNLSSTNQIISSQKDYFNSIIGLEKEKRALAIAAAGGHNILLNGSPGCGKTILARSFQNLLPKMSKSEKLETTKIFSISGLLNSKCPIIHHRPFREVHSTASSVAIISGGGKIPVPGEITLAHNGVLFLDEISEFPRSILESLRQPLENKFINLNRSKFSVQFPSDFSLIATTNPCPCGYRFDRVIKCICSQSQVDQYQKKLSGPLLDRIDLFLNIEKINAQRVLDSKVQDNLKPIKEKIIYARSIQEKRFKSDPKVYCNSQMNLKELKLNCQVNKETRMLLDKAVKNLKLSTRAYLKILKLARTIADYSQSENIQRIHVAEALQYRNSFREI